MNEVFLTETIADEQPASCNAASLKPTKKLTFKSKDNSASTNSLVAGQVKVDNDIGDIESLTEEQTKDRLHKVQSESDEMCFIMGALFDRVYEKKWFKPHQTFDKFVENEYGVKGRKARYYIDIFRKTRATELPLEFFRKIRWTKLRIIARVLDKENAAYWTQLAAEKSKRELEHLVRNACSNQTEKKQETETKTLAFKPKFLQSKPIEAAIKKAMDLFDVADQRLALEKICEAFLTGVHSD